MTDPYTQPNREWWAQRWIDVLESFGWRRRLERARNYARQGNVLNIDHNGHKVSARVQGTAPEPYKVSLSLEPFTDEQWSYVIESMSQQAIFSAKLLAGEMPQNIEKVFTENGLSLFPFTKFDIRSRCSCPDPANPCKHIGAVYYVLGDRFSEDPFVLFQLRGRTKEQIIEALRQMRSLNSASGDEGDSISAEAASAPTVPVSSPIQMERFWHYNQQLEPSLVVIAPAPHSETVLDVLGAIPLKASATNGTAPTPSAAAPMEQLKSIYQAANLHAIQTAMTTNG